ncbi:type II secretion system F family protein [Candidatus Peregrinibacteria bacterium]|nr:type II secretion system F family protein [Candidatus Peregrinibacteria bacterium]
MSPATLHIGAAAGKEEAVKTKAPEAHGKRPMGVIGRLNAYLARFSAIKDEDKVSFFRLMATMINAGISITKSLRILTEQIENVHFKQIIEDLTMRIESGASFSEALSAHDKYFNAAQIGMVESGEATGRLNQALLQIASETEKSTQLNKKIKGAMIYPVTIIVILIGAMYAVMTFVMPKIKEVFESLGSQLPAMTQFLVDASDWMVGKTAGIPNGLLVLISLVAFVFLFLWWKKTKVGRLLWTKATMRLPVFGNLIKKSALARFCRSISTLTNSGISIVKALEITAGSVGNPIYEKRIRLISEDVKRGITMGENMKDDPLFPTMVVGMINVAEQTAQMDQITGKLADFYEEELDDMVKNLSRLMEPIIIVILGGTVGFLVIAVMLPILQSSDLATAGS